MQVRLRQVVRRPPGSGGLDHAVAAVDVDRFRGNTGFDEQVRCGQIVCWPSGTDGIADAVAAVDVDRFRLVDQARGYEDGEEAGASQIEDGSQLTADSRSGRYVET